MNIRHAILSITTLTFVATLTACNAEDHLDGHAYLLEGFNDIEKIVYFEGAGVYDIDVISQPAPILEYEITDEHLILTNGRHYFYLTYDDLSKDVIRGEIVEVEETDLDHAEQDFEFTPDALGSEYTLEKVEPEREVVLPDS